MNNNTTILKEIQPNGRTFNSHLVKLYKTRKMQFVHGKAPSKMERYPIIY